MIGNFELFILIFSVSFAYELTLTPQHPVVLEHQNITFNCSASSSSVELSFTVNDTNIEQLSESERKQFDLKVCELENFNRKEASLTFNVSALYNETIIKCVAILSDHNPKSKKVTLLVQGPIGSVDNLKSIKTYTGTKLIWTPPYILPGLHITGYYIDIIDTTVTENHAFIHYKYITSPCRGTVVTVVPTIGSVMGEPANITVSYIDPDKSEPIIKVKVELLQSKKDNVTVNVVLTENVYCLFENDLPSEVNITIDGKNYTRGLERVGRKVQTDTPINLSHKKELVGLITLESKSFNFNFKTLAVSVEKNSNCFTCKFISNVSEEHGCQLNLTASDDDNIAIQFLRTPASSLRVLGCINGINLSFYDIHAYAIYEQDVLSLEPVQHWKRENMSVTCKCKDCFKTNNTDDSKNDDSKNDDSKNDWCIPVGVVLGMFFIVAVIVIVIIAICFWIYKKHNTDNYRIEKKDKY